ncbi:hypothetical protein K502DRAFT_362351 [Neoconidiobolus thromboides FSU 785]|nr:hypothetical protein K502DRAFT_362351 [Neoconidiobolus thromboides FSU 785]
MIYKLVKEDCNLKSSNVRLLKQAIGNKPANYRNGLDVKSKKYDCLFEKYKAFFGGQVQLLGVTAAPISLETLEVVKLIMLADIIKDISILLICYDTTKGSVIVISYKSELDSDRVGSLLNK